MSLLLNHSMEDALALLRGDLGAVTSAPDGFPITGLSVWQLTGLEPAIGSELLDSDEAWQSVVSGWWSLGVTCGLLISGSGDAVSWSLALPNDAAAAVDGVRAHLPGAKLESHGDFGSHAGRLTRLRFRAAMAGHPGTGSKARLETTIRSMIGREFAILILARASARPEIQDEVARWSAEEQFIRDEHLARPGLERDNHSAASRYLALVEAARERANAALQEGGWQVRTLVAATSEHDFRQLQSLVHAAYGSDGGQPEPLRWQDVTQARGITFLRSSEVAALSRPPRKELPGLAIENYGRSAAKSGEVVTSIFGTTAPPLGSGRAICVGRILADDGQPGAWLNVGTKDLCRHVLVAGMTGVGKSTTCEHLLLELWREHRIPWLVVEPGMNPSYRRLLNSEMGADIRVYSIGNPNSDRLAMNPLAAPAGIGLAEHISGLFSVINSAFELVAPMPEVLASAIEDTYRNHGWDPSGLVPEGRAPQLSDLILEIDRSTRSLGYGPEVAGNIRAGLLLRLNRLARGPLAPELCAQGRLHVRTLVSTPCVIELSSLPDANSQALVLGFLAQQLRHHWRLAGPSSELRHVTLIEEAHRLLRAVPETVANATRTRAVEDIANMLAELRAFGAGLVIVDQTPSALVPSVIANTGTKILHRLDHPADRELAGRSAGLATDRVDLLGALRVGEAILRTDRRPRPFRLRMPNPAVTYGEMPMPVLRRTGGKFGTGPTPSVLCEVCGNGACVAATAGAEANQLVPRLRTLKLALARSEDAVWSWAIDELGRTECATVPGSAPLCFLIAVGRAAELPEAALNNLRTNLSPRTDTNPPVSPKPEPPLT